MEIVRANQAEIAQAKKERMETKLRKAEAQNKRHDIFEKQQREEERQKRQEAKAAKEAAAEQRRLAIENERQARLQELLKKRKIRDAKIEHQLQEKERERRGAVRVKEKEREDRLQELKSQQQASMEELHKKIEKKERDHARRHEEHLEETRAKALEMSRPLASVNSSREGVLEAEYGVENAVDNSSVEEEKDEAEDDGDAQSSEEERVSFGEDGVVTVKRKMKKSKFQERMERGSIPEIERSGDQFDWSFGMRGGGETGGSPLKETEEKGGSQETMEDVDAGLGDVGHDDGSGVDRLDNDDIDSDKSNHDGAGRDDDNEEFLDCGSLAEIKTEYLPKIDDDVKIIHCCCC